MSALADEEALSLGGQEISREEAILAYLKSEEVHDFTLEGNDGISFGANRYMLAARVLSSRKCFSAHSRKLPPTPFSWTILEPC